MMVEIRNERRSMAGNSEEKICEKLLCCPAEKETS